LLSSLFCDRSVVFHTLSPPLSPFQSFASVRLLSEGTIVPLKVPVFLEYTDDGVSSSLSFRLTFLVFCYNGLVPGILMVRFFPMCLPPPCVKTGRTIRASPFRFNKLLIAFFLAFSLATFSLQECFPSLMFFFLVR